MLQQLEPIVVHPGEKLTLDWISRNRANDRIDAALRAKGRIAIVSPIFNLARRKHFQTVEAATQMAFSECRAVVA